MNDIPAQTACGPVRARIVADVARIPQARRWISGLGTEAGLPEADVQRLAVAVHEIIANAIKHGGGQASVSADLGERRVTVTVTDTGTVWRGTIPVVRPETGQFGGRGLWLAANLCDDLTIEHGPDGTSVRMVVTASPATGL